MNVRTTEKRAAEFERVYGSAARIEWMIRQRSIVSGRSPCVNAHIRTGGMGRKADACFICPLTFEEHNELHAHGQKSFEAKYGIDLLAAAVETERRWREHLAKGDEF